MVSYREVTNLEDRISSVLILIVVDNGLVLLIMFVAKENSRVLILIVVDNGLVPENSSAWY